MSKDVDESWSYFALDFPGLSRDDAERILESVREQGPALSSLLSGEGVTPGWIVEPGFAYVRYLDNCTVRTLKKASQIALAAGQLSDHESVVLVSMVEDFADWLEQAEAGDDDCAHE